MFTGIIETLGKVIILKKENTNLHIVIESSLNSELKIDQSINHNGVCLTITSIDGNTYTVTAIEETLNKTNLNSIQTGSLINLERSLKLNDRLDGHMVQGHVDTTAELIQVENKDGSYLLAFSIDKKYRELIVEKGSICLNGVSLTIVAVDLPGGNKNSVLFSVAIIPYTWDNTNLQYLKKGDKVNVEFDIVGKYVRRMMSSN
ncbi:MAG: riboflavin synthase [Chitinophagales bacterium]